MFKIAPLLLSMTLASAAGTTGCYDEVEPKLNCEGCDEISTDGVSTQTLFEFSAGEEGALESQIATFKSVFDTQLNLMGFGTRTEATRGGDLASIDFTMDTVLTENDAPLSWSGLIKQGGSLKLETYKSGAQVLILDFGTLIYTADGREVAPNTDRFAALGEQRFILSNRVTLVDNFYRAQNESGEILNGGIEEVAAHMRVAMVPDASNAVRSFSGAEAERIFNGFIGTREAYSESLGDMSPVNGSVGVSFLLQASVEGDMRSMPVSVFRNYGDGSGNTPITAFGFEGGAGVPAEYLNLVAEDGTYTIEGIAGLNMVYGDYTVYVAFGENHDYPESVYKFLVKGGTPKAGLVQICNNYNCL